MYTDIFAHADSKECIIARDCLRDCIILLATSENMLAKTFPLVSVVFWGGRGL